MVTMRADIVGYRSLEKHRLLNANDSEQNQNTTTNYQQPSGSYAALYDAPNIESVYRGYIAVTMENHPIHTRQPYLFPCDHINKIL
jgi:hypothetical protein